jgi:hypothetical protein
MFRFGIPRAISFSTVFCALALLLGAACSQGVAPAPPIANREGGLQLTYEDVADPLTGLRETNAGGLATSGWMRLRPSSPPSGLSADQETDYWLGGTSEAMRRCGYTEEVAALRALATDSSLFARGANKVQGSRMASCAQALRLANSILSHEKN